MKNIKTILFIIFFASIFGCQKEMMDYIGESGIYFRMQKPPISNYGDSTRWAYADTTALPFSTTINNDSAYVLKFRIIGNVVNYDRKFKFVIVDTSTTAVEGREFDKIEDYYTVAAGKEESHISIKFHRTKEISNSHLFVTFMLVPTEDFSLPLKSWRPTDNSYNSDNENTSVIRHTIDISDDVFRPTIWTFTIWGQSATDPLLFTKHKFNLVCSLFKLTQKDFESQTTMPRQKEQYYGKMFQKYLNQKEADGDPVYEIDDQGNMVYETDKLGNQVPKKMKLGWLANS